MVPVYPDAGKRDDAFAARHSDSDILVFIDPKRSPVFDRDMTVCEKIYGNHESTFATGVFSHNLLPKTKIIAKL